MGPSAICENDDYTTVVTFDASESSDPFDDPKELAGGCSSDSDCPSGRICSLPFAYDYQTDAGVMAAPDSDDDGYNDVSQKPGFCLIPLKYRWELSDDSAKIVGGSLEVEVDSVTSGTWLAFLIVGLTDPALDVTAMLTGMSGLSGTVLHSSLDDLLPMPLTGHRAQGSLPVPNDPSLAGFQFQAQPLLVAPGESLLDLVLGDAVAVTIGG